jgi:hypothetical protein
MSALLLGLGVIMVIEFGYHLSLESARSSVALLFGLPFDAAAGSTWVMAVGTLLAGGLAFDFMRRRFRKDWDDVQGEIQLIENKR